MICCENIMDISLFLKNNLSLSLKHQVKSKVRPVSKWKELSIKTSNYPFNLISNMSWSQDLDYIIKLNLFYCQIRSSLIETVS